MNKKEHFESEQAIELTARALGETDTCSSPSFNGQNSEVQMDVEFEQRRQLGRIIRDSSSHDAEKWASPDDVARLKDLIESEIVSGKLMSTDNTGQMRLAALAASILLIAGIGYALVRSPRVETAAVVNEHGNDRQLADSVKGNVLDEIGNSLSSQSEAINAKNLRGNSIIPDLRISGEKKSQQGDGSDLDDVSQTPGFAGSVPVNGKVIHADMSSANSVDLALQPLAPVPDAEYSNNITRDSIGAVDNSIDENRFYLAVPQAKKEDSIAVDPGNTTGPLPIIAGSNVTNGIVAPDGGKILFGATTWSQVPLPEMTQIGGIQVADASLGAKADSELLLRQNLLGAEHPSVREPARYADEISELREMEGDFGFRVNNDRLEQPTNEQYSLPPENRFLTPVAERALSTFSIDVDTASYANIRRFITNGQLPPGNAVRIEEMVNYFSYGYPQPVDGKPFSVSLDVAQCPWQPANKLVRVGIQGREIPRDDRPASNLVFLIDVSGSMSDANKLPLLQRSLLMLVDQLTENDRVSIVTYASDAGIRLQPTSGDQKQVIRDVINSLSSGGSTHGSAGITTAYELATQQFIDGGTNRVLLATDGDLNVGVTDDDELVQLIKSRAQSGVFLSVLGFGTGNLKDGKLEKIADNGNGQYCYVDSIREAQKVLVSELSGSLVTIAKDVKLQIEFNPAEVAGYRLIGYENRTLKNEDFANDRVDAGDIGAGHSVTAFYEIVPVKTVAKPKPDAISGMRYQRAQAVEQPVTVDDDQLTDAARSSELMYVALRFKQPESSESDLLEVTVKASDLSFDAASADFKFAASVAAFGMKLRQSAYTGDWTWSDIENIAVATIGDDPQGHRAELVDLVRQTRKMLGR